jgi:hypothetical protein
MAQEGYGKSVKVNVSPPNPKARDRYCQIDVGVACVRYGGSVTFIASRECGPLTVLVPRPPRAPKVFPHLRTLVFHVPAGGRRTLHVLSKKHQTTHPREYPYAVYCHKHNCFAKGSMPRMMIGP